jgi:hypothetical protein
MAETKVPASIDPDHLTAEQVEKLRFVLGQFSLHQLVRMAYHAKWLCKLGFGSVNLIIDNHHLSRIVPAPSYDIPPETGEDELRSLME